jgi:filamentous hemagglutinin family protein
MAKKRQKPVRSADHRKQYHPLPKALACMVAACFAADVAWANPVNPTVVNGQASFNSSGKSLTITNSPGSIINWQGFSIGVGEITSFVQQSASSAVLNRVTGIDPSIILGTLQSNGRVFLINPNGILFGAGSRIDVAGLVASTLNLSDQDFLSGKLNFTATAGAGSLINQGAITTPTGGQVYLIAPDVKNSGIITSPQGQVVLAAGHSVELVDAGTPDLQVEVTAPDTKAINLGQIIADSGQIGIYAGLIKNNGTLQANTVVAGQNGQILLVASNSTTLGATSKITATGQQAGTTGGTVEVTGNAVTLDGGSTIDVSGQSGGGTILVGGGEHGADPNVPNAQFTTVDSGASLIADATNSGNGGEVIVWSDNTTQFDGSISARGGPNGGNGGFAEVSGEQNLYLTGHADLSAANGKFGTLLLDPGTVIIEHGGGEGGPDTFSDSYIASQLNLGDLVISTSDADTSNGVAQDINFNSASDDIEWSNPTTLTLTAGNDINYQGTIFVAQAGAGVNLNAGNNIDVNGSITAPVISLVATSGITVESGAQLYASSNSGSTSTTLAAGNGGITVYGLVQATGSEDGPGGGSGFVSLTTSGTGQIKVNGGQVIADGGEGGESTPGGSGTVSMTSGSGGILITNGGSVSAGGASGTDSEGGGSASITLNGSSGGITLTNDGSVQSQGTGGGSASVTLTTTGGILVDGAEVSNIEAYGGDGYDGGMAGGAANIVLTSGSGGIMIDNAYIYAEGGDGGYNSSGNGGAGGDASISLTSTTGGGITIQNNGYANALGGSGGDGEWGSGGAGGSASVTLSGGSGPITFDTSGAVEADGGEGGYGDTNGGAGGLATVSLATTGAILIQGGGEVYAHGGDGGESSNNNGGNGGVGSITIGDGTNTGITINGGYVWATGGDGGESENSGTGGTGGSAIVALNGGGSGVLIENGSDPASVRADGGEGGYGYSSAFGGNGGSASITLTGPAITIQTGGGVLAYGGNGNDGGEGGGAGGGGSIIFNAGVGGINISNPNYAEAEGGEGLYGYYSGTGAIGGAASMTLTTAGALSLNNADLYVYGADGGEGTGGSGGAGSIFFNAGGVVSLNNSDVYAYGGEGYGGSGGGAATIGIAAGGGISGVSSYIEAFGGSAYSSNGGTANLTLLSTGGNIVIDGGEGAAVGGEAYDEGFVGGGAGALVRTDAGNITIQNDGDVETDGGYGNGGGGGPALTSLVAGGNIMVQNDSYAGAYGGYDEEAETYANAGVAVTALGSITFDNDSGAYAYGAGSFVLVTTAGSLNVTNGSNVEANSPLENDGLVVVSAGQDVNVAGGDDDFTASSIYGGAEVDMTVGGTVHIDAGGGEGSSAQIAANSSDTIFVHFFGSLTSGGYFVNGQEGVIYDTASESGFAVNDVAAVLNQNLFIDYTNPSNPSTPASSSGLPTDVTTALDYIISEINQNIENTDNNQEEDNGDKNKKTCS